jgi:hypothetical protein
MRHFIRQACVILSLFTAPQPLFSSRPHASPFVNARIKASRLALCATWRNMPAHSQCTLQLKRASHSFCAVNNKSSLDIHNDVPCYVNSVFHDIHTGSLH